MLQQTLKLILQNIRSKAARPPGQSLSEQPSPKPAFHAFLEFLGTVPWNGIHQSGYRTDPNVMSASMSDQAATCRLEFLYELFRFHNFKELVNNTAKIYNNITLTKYKAIFL